MTRAFGLTAKARRSLRHARRVTLAVSAPGRR